MKPTYCFLILLSFLLIHCNEENAFPSDNESITASAFITIVDTDGEPLKEASIHINNDAGYTNDQGQYFFRDIAMTGSTFLTAEKPGYFKGSRRFHPQSGRTAYIRIIMLPLETAGSFDSQYGGTVNIDGFSTITFPPNAIVYDHGASFAGTVYVKAVPIYADDPDLSDKMPGHLIGINAAGEKGLLSSFGMVAVELQNASGTRLNLADGAYAQIRFYIPDHLVNTAPATIPLWFFDETVGYWKEEGYAIRDANQYIGIVGHFSFWNCDDWAESLRWEGSFLLSNGEPAVNLKVCLTVERLNTVSCDYTNQSGILSGMVPINERLRLVATDQCGNELHAESLGPYTTDESNVIMLSASPFIKISGNAVDCNHQPISKGHLRIEIDNSEFLLDLKNGDGNFEQSFIACQKDLISIVAVDEKLLLSSPVKQFPAQSEINTGTLVACESLDQYISFKVKGNEHQYFYFYPEVRVYDIQGVQRTSLYCQGTKAQGGDFYLNFDSVSEGLFECTIDGGIYLEEGILGYPYDMYVAVQEFGDVGGYIKGTFTGKISSDPGIPLFKELSGSFSAKRDQ